MSQSSLSSSKKASNITCGVCALKQKSSMSCSTLALFVKDIYLSLASIFIYSLHILPPAMDWCPIRGQFCHLASSITGIGSGYTMTLTRIKGT